MNATTKTLLIAFALVAVFLLFFSNGTMSNALITGGMMEHGAMVEVGRVWMPTLLSFVLGALLAWVIFGHKK